MAPGKICVTRRAVQGTPAAIHVWEYWRDKWLATRGWNKVLSEPSMFLIATDTSFARMEVKNDDFLVIAPDDATLEALSRPLVDSWKLEILKLTPETPVETRN